MLEDASKHVARVLSHLDKLLKFVRTLTKVAGGGYTGNESPVESESCLLEQVFERLKLQDPPGSGQQVLTEETRQVAEDAVLEAFVAGGGGALGEAAVATVEMDATGAAMLSFTKACAAALELIRWGDLPPRPLQSQSERE